EVAPRRAREEIAILADHADPGRRLEVDGDGGIRALVDGPVERLLVLEAPAVGVGKARKEEARLSVGLGREEEVGKVEHGYVLHAERRVPHHAGALERDVGAGARDAPRRLLEAAAP